MPDSSTWFSPAASQGPISSRSVSENRLFGTLTMPRKPMRRSRMVPPGAMRNARKFVVPQSTPIMSRFPFVYPSSDASSAALPPAAEASTDTTRSSANRNSVIGPPAFGPVPDKPRPPNGCTPTPAPIWLRFT